jgi:hypothetical protein
MENWKSLSPLNFSRFEVSDKGRVRRSSNHNLLGLTKRIVAKKKKNHPQTKQHNLPVDNSGKGIKRVAMFACMKNDNGKTKTCQVHRLVAKSFIPNPENKPTVDHINRDSTDNRAENLRWASHKEQSANRKPAKTHIGRPVYKLDITGNIIQRYETVEDARKELGCTSSSSISAACKNHGILNGFYWDYCDVIDSDLPEEIWKEYTDENKNTFLVSNKGRVQTDQGKRFGHEDGLYLVVKYKGLRHSISLLVAELFIGPNPDNKQVDHIDRDTHNNDVINLRYVTRNENCLNKSYTKQEKTVVEVEDDGHVWKSLARVGSPNYEISDEGNVRSSITKRKAVFSTDRNRQDIDLLLSNGKHLATTLANLTAKMFIPNYWNSRRVIHKDGDSYNNNVSNLAWVVNKKKNPVCFLTESGKIGLVYKDARTAEQCYCLSRKSIHNACKNKGDIDGVQWRFFNELVGRLEYGEFIWEDE